jgi:hypothetical protein
MQILRSVLGAKRNILASEIFVQLQKRSSFRVLVVSRVLMPTLKDSTFFGSIVFFQIEIFLQSAGHLHVIRPYTAHDSRHAFSKKGSA